MFKIYQRIISFFQKPKPKYDFNEFIEAHKEDVEKPVVVEKVKLENTIEDSIGVLKNNRTSHLNIITI